MQEAVTLLEMAVVFGCPIAVFVAIVRVVAGELPIDLFARGGDLSWPRGVQEQDVPRFKVDAIERPGTKDGRLGPNQQGAPRGDQPRPAAWCVPAVPLDHN